MSIPEHIAAERLVTAQRRMRPITQRVEQTARKIGARYQDDRVPVHTAWDMIGAVAHDAAVVLTDTILPQGYYPDHDTITRRLEAEYARGYLSTHPSALYLETFYTPNPLQVSEVLSFMNHRKKRQLPYEIQYAHIALLHWFMEQGTLGRVFEQLITVFEGAGQHDVFQISYGNARDMLWHYIMLSVDYGVTQVEYSPETPWRWQAPLIMQHVFTYMGDLHRWKNLRDIMLWTMPRTIDRVNRLNGIPLQVERQNGRL